MDRTSSCLALTLLLAIAACMDSPEEPGLENSTGQTSVPLATVSHLDLGTLGGSSSYAADVNDLGIVVGWSVDSAGTRHAFRWTVATGMTDLGTLPGDDWSRAISISITGQILGLSGRVNDPHGAPVIWTTSGPPVPLSIPLPTGAGFVVPEDRSAFGQVTGSSGGGTRPSHAWAWNAPTGLYDITAHLLDAATTGESYGSEVNAWGVVVGTNHARVCTNPLAGECWHAFLWNALTGYRDIGIPMGNSLSRTQVTGLAINDLGIVAGWTSPHGAFPPTQPYIWNERTGFTLLPNFSTDSGSRGGYAQAVNLIGTAAGSSEDAGAFQAAAWPRAGGIVKLSPDDANPSVAVAISGSGIVVGWSSLDCCGLTGNHATLWKLGPGRGVTPTILDGAPQSRSLAAARAWTESAQVGPVACLSDPVAITSKRALIDCVVRRSD